MVLTINSRRGGGGSLDTEAVQDVIGAMVAAAGGTYNDAAGTITLPSGAFDPSYYITAYSPAADGATSDSTPFANALTDMADGDTLVLDANSYGLGTYLPTTKKKITVRGKSGGATLKRLASGTADPYMMLEASATVGGYVGWTFEDIIFDGNLRTLLTTYPYASISLNGARDITFRRCVFRDLCGPGISMSGCRNILFEDCAFIGTAPGVMTAGAQDPTAVTTALYGAAVTIGSGNVNIRFIRPRLHVVASGIVGNAAATKTTEGLLIEDIRARNDWWCTPYVTKRFTPTAYNNSTKVLTVSGGGFTGFFPAGQSYICSVPVSIATGTAFTTIYQNEVIVGSAIAAARVGDTFETVTGLRAEITAITSTTEFTVRGWEAIDTLEASDPPAVADDWRLVRFYASPANFTSDTTITLEQEPVEHATGARLVTDDAGTPVGVVCRTFAKTGYGGLHANGAVNNLTLRGGEIRGSWADAGSIFDCEAPRVEGVNFEYTQDEAITLTRCPRAIALGNHGRLIGTSLIAHDACTGASFTGNVIRDWATVNRAVKGAIEGGSVRAVISGNAFDYDSTAGMGGASPYAIHFAFYDGTGMVVGANGGSGRTGDIYVESSATGGIRATTPVAVAGSSAGQIALVKRPQEAGQTIAYAASITPSAKDGAYCKVGTLTGNLTINAPINAAAWDILTFDLLQDGTGGRVVTFNATFKNVPTLTTTASTREVVSFVFDGTDWVRGVA